jgi:serine/threonine protein kinase
MTKEWTLSDFEIGKLLGQGKYGNVYVVREKSTGFICAMKVLVKCYLLRECCEKQIIREIDILMNMKFVYYDLNYTFKDIPILLDFTDIFVMI